jgi:hypothetical protein
VRAPRFGRAVPTRWTRPLIVNAMRNFQADHGRRMGANDCKVTPPDMPSLTAIVRVFGSFRAASEAAYGSSLPPGGRYPGATKDDDTELVIAELAAGRSLTELAAERGIAGQALGRRVRRYQAAHDLPVVNRRPGRRKAA